MPQNEKLIELLKNRADIPINLVQFIKITSEDNCMLWMFSYYLYDNENQ